MMTAHYRLPDGRVAKVFHHGDWSGDVRVEVVTEGYHTPDGVYTMPGDVFVAVSKVAAIDVVRNVVTSAVERALSDIEPEGQQ